MDDAYRHQAGRLAEAEGIYRQILAAQPQNADAMQLQRRHRDADGSPGVWNWS
jgi:hypothetical protein